MIQCRGVLRGLGAQRFDVQIRQAGFAPFGVVETFAVDEGNEPLGFHRAQCLNQRLDAVQRISVSVLMINFLKGPDKIDRIGDPQTRFIVLVFSAAPCRNLDCASQAPLHPGYAG